MTALGHEYRLESDSALVRGQVHHTFAQAGVQLGDRSARLELETSSPRASHHLAAPSQSTTLVPGLYHTDEFLESIICLSNYVRIF
jgi:hypothetical protein